MPLGMDRRHAKESSEKTFARRNGRVTRHALRPKGSAYDSGAHAPEEEEEEDLLTVNKE